MVPVICEAHIMSIDYQHFVSNPENKSTVRKVYHRPLLFFGGGGDILLVNGGKIYIYF